MTIAKRSVGTRASSVFVGAYERLGASSVMVTAIVLVLVFLLFSLSAPGFLTFSSLSNIMTFASATGFAGLGMALVLISAEFDMSIGSILAVGQYVFLFTVIAGLPPLVALFLALAGGGLLGLINGVLVNFTGLPSFIVTLGTMFGYRGIAYAVSTGRAASSFTTYGMESTPNLLFAVLNGDLTPINRLTDPPGNLRMATVWYIAVIAVMSIILMRSPYGNWVFAVGGNRQASLAQGVDVRRVKLINFVVSGCLAAFSGVVVFARTPSATQLSGMGLELVLVTAAVIGGVSLFGGTGTILGAALGMLLMKTLEQGLVLMSVDANYLQGVIGLMLIFSVIIHTYLRREA